MSEFDPDRHPDCAQYPFDDETQDHDLDVGNCTGAGRVYKLVLVAPDGFASPGFEYDKATEVLIWGDQDAMIPVANAQDYLRVMRDARVVTLPGVGHMPHEEAAADSLPAVKAFLAP